MGKLETNLTITIKGDGVHMEGQYVGTKANLTRLAGTICGMLGVMPPLDEMKNPAVGLMFFLGMMKGAEDRAEGSRTAIEFAPNGKETFPED